MSFSTSAYLERLQQTLGEFPHQQFDRLVGVFVTALATKRKILIMGNGGSAATASHWVCDVNKGCSHGYGQRFRMICLNDNVGSVTAYANDVSYDDAFVEQLKNFLDPGDVVIAISASGKSKNVLKAIRYANDHEGLTVGLVGFDGGELMNLVKVPLHVRSHDMQIVEDVHGVIMHMCMQSLREKQVLSAQSHVESNGRV